MIDVAGALRDMVLIVIKLGGPLLTVVLIVGLVVSLLQAITQVNEASLVFLPKALALCATLILMGPFIAATLTDFMTSLMDRVVLAGAP